MDKTANIKIRILNVKTKLFPVLGSSFTRFAKRDRYRLSNLSNVTAIIAITIMSIIVVRGMETPNSSTTLDRSFTANLR
jgi:hypothetical protein